MPGYRTAGRAPRRSPVPSAENRRRLGSSTVKTYPTANIRNVALVGHSGSGKTTLVEAMLARAGAIPRIGRVEYGTSVSDIEPEEIKRRISLSLAVAPIEWEGCRIN